MSESWREVAACAETGPELFFPGKGESTRMARAICGGCEVRAECLRDALDTDDVHFGVRGGLPPRGRRRLRDGQRDAA